jgi:aspartate/methionine/tyrosine aminotransferase
VQPVPVLAASAALWRDETHVIANRALYAEKFSDASAIFGNRFGFYRPGGGFFLWLDVGNGETAAKRLWAEAGLRVLPGAYLARDAGQGNPGQAYIRVALVHDRARTKQAMTRMAEVLEDL